MVCIVRVVGGNPGKKILKTLAGHQITVEKGRPAEFGQQAIPRALEPDRDPARVLEHIANLILPEEIRALRESGLGC